MMINEPPSTSGNFLATISPVKGQGRRNADIKLNHGTTAVGFIYQGGIILCADSRITQGNVILSKSMLKAFPVSNHIMATVAGGAADCSFWIRSLAWESCLHELKYNEPMSLLSAATVISNLSMEERSSGRSLNMGIILAGRDKAGHALFRIDNDGFIIQGSAFAVGGGSASALGILDNGFDYDLTDKQAFDLGCRAIYYASMADAMTGGAVSLHHMAKDAWETVAIIDCQELHNNFARGLNYAGEEIVTVMTLQSKMLKNYAGEEMEDEGSSPPKRLKMAL